MFYRINWKLADRHVLLTQGANAAPAVSAGFTDLGSFEHGDVQPKDSQLPGMQRYPDNHVLVQHVQEALYHIGEWNLQMIKITVPDGTVVRVPD